MATTTSPQQVYMARDNFVLCVGCSYTLTPIVLPGTASQSVTYESTDPSVVSVDANGVVFAHSEGSVDIYITSTENSNLFAAVIVDVSNCGVDCDDCSDRTAVQSITLNSASTQTVSVGDTGTITATVEPSYATDTSVYWHSSDTSVLTCTSAGKYTAKAAGTAVLTAYCADGVYATVTFTVGEAGEEPEDPVVPTETTSDRAYSVHDDEVTASHSIGPNATGMIDLRDGTLKFSVTDFAWDGYLQPVTIRHLYTSALKDKHFSGSNISGLTLKDFSTMQTGLGWRLNYMISLVAGTEQENGEAVTVYTFVDREGDIYKLYPTPNTPIINVKINWIVE